MLHKLKSIGSNLGFPEITEMAKEIKTHFKEQQSR